MSDREKLTTVPTDLRVPFHRASVDEAEVRAVSEVIRSGWLTMGPKTFQFEEEFARYVGAPHAVAVSSCTAALHLALEAIGLDQHHEVLVPTMTFTATAEVVAYFGAKPVLVDVDPQTLNLDPSDAARRVTSSTIAIIPVHYAGQPCPMDEIQGLSTRHGLHVIEDAAHALPAEYRGARIGTLSDLTAFSFYATKTLTTGEGGMVTTADPGLAERIRTMRLHGISRDAWRRYSHAGSWYYEVEAAGFKYNLTDIQAALGLVQLQKCDRLRERRRAIAERYNSAFQQIAALEIPTVSSDREPSWHLYVLRLHPERLRIGREQFIEALRYRGIGASVHFIPLHLHPYYQATYGYARGQFPVAEMEYARSISLPIYPDMTNDDINAVIENVCEICEEQRV